MVETLLFFTLLTRTENGFIREGTQVSLLCLPKKVQPLTARNSSFVPSLEFQFCYPCSRCVRIVLMIVIFLPAITGPFVPDLVTSFKRL